MAALLAAGVLVLIGLAGLLSVLPAMSFQELIFAVPTDTALGYCIFVGLLALQRWNRLGIALAIALPSLLLAASWLKLSILQMPVSVGDILLLPDLARTQEGWVVVLAAFASIGLIVAFLANARLRPNRLLATAPIAGMLVLLVAAEASPSVARLAVEQLPHRLDTVPLGHFARVGRAHLDDAHERHETRALVGMLENFAPAEAPLPPLRQRNVHVVLLESFVDPQSFQGLSWTQEPLTPLFVRWRDTNGSTAVTPVFGNGSSNTEFEVLCGLPTDVGRTEIVFFRIRPESRLRCLPAMLATAGFRTLALVPNSPSFFAAGQAFAVIGFQDSAFAPDLDMSDLDGIWLSAAATLRQTRERAFAAMRQAPDRPLLSYTFVNAGHFPFVRNERLRPTLLGTTPADRLLRDWVNSLHHTALAIEDHVAAIRAADPSALIVIMGDHAPPFSAEMNARRRGGNGQPVGMAFLERAETFETPLLILDGPTLVDVGRLPAWQLPSVLLDILSDGAHCAQGCAHDRAWRLRPFRDLVLAIEAKGSGQRPCRRQRGAQIAQDSACSAYLAEAEHLHILLRWRLMAPPSSTPPGS